MHLIIISTAGGILATILIMLAVRRILHRVRTGRKLSALIGQDQYEYLIVDVRTAGEFAKARIPGALHLPVGEMEGNLPTEKMFEPIYVYGRTWQQARRASRLLDATGYFNVTCYGGFRGWRGPRESDKD